ncbi:hypothetical protein U1Q18_024160 [Sarracenia purpurea var. burkii]
MVKGKSRSHLSMVKDGEIAENRDRVAPRKGIEGADHWAFLDEIEAPMWVDLNLEASSCCEDNGDDWFQISHPFHQCSSRQLISALSHLCEGNANMDFGNQDPSSPKLPPSVSRSRGKQYRSRKWGDITSRVASNKQHPVKILSSKSSWASLGSGQEKKTKPSNGYQKGNTKSKEDSVCESNLTETSGPNFPKPSSSVGDSKTSLSSAENKEIENKSVSTITLESSVHQHQKLLEVSSQTPSHISGLLSTLKVTLRRSCVTRQASRVEIAGGRQSEGRKSSSGKSSVGSSSHPGYDVKIASQATKDKVKVSNMSKESTTKTHNLTSKSRWGNKPIAVAKSVSNMSKESTTMTQNLTHISRWGNKPIAVAKSVSNMSKESTAMTQNLTPKSRWGNKHIAVAKSAHLETGKSKVVLHSKAMGQHRVNQQVYVTAGTKVDGRVGVNKYNRLGDGKENAMSWRSNIRTGGMFQVQKVEKQIIVPQTSSRTGLIVPEGKASGGKCLGNVIQKVYLR